MSKSEKVSEFVGECLVKFVFRQFKIISAWIVDPILKSSVQDCPGGDDLSRRRVESALESKPYDFRRQAQPIKNRAVRVEYNRALSATIAGVGIRG